MEIRILTDQDAAEWARLRLESLLREPHAFSSSAEDQQSLTLEEVRQRLASDGSEFFIVGAFEQGAFEQSALVGMAGFHREKGLKSRHKGRVWGVYVTPGSRGQGVGRKLVQAVLQLGAKIEGVEQILISVTTTQVAATALYRSLGFESFGREPRALKLGDEFIDEEHMVVRVKAGR
jgi:ribosomal protein S18 acetylase RimI-like enzyme